MVSTSVSTRALALFSSYLMTFFFRSANFFVGAFEKNPTKIWRANPGYVEINEIIYRNFIGVFNGF
jgi:hypothetical protein